MINSVEFTDSWRCFKTGDRFIFRPGVNLLVGDQGCGKSSLFKILVNRAKAVESADRDKKLAKKAFVDCDTGQVYSKDFEHENPRTMSYFGEHARLQLAMMFKSHGESNRVIIDAIGTAKTCVMLLDEPDTALSIRSCKLLVERFKEVAAKGSQVVAAVHNIQVIQEFEEVLSLEHGKWVKSQDFINTQLEG